MKRWVGFPALKPKQQQNLCLGFLCVSLIPLGHRGLSGVFSILRQKPVGGGDMSSNYQCPEGTSPEGFFSLLWPLERKLSLLLVVLACWESDLAPNKVRTLPPHPATEQLRAGPQHVLFFSIKKYSMYLYAQCLGSRDKGVSVNSSVRS